MRRQPQRSCVGCRTVRAKQELVRIVRTPTGEIEVDEGRGKMPGRGAYLCRDGNCLRRALKTRALERALKQPLPEAVVARLEALLEDHRPESAGPLRGEDGGEGTVKDREG